MKILSNYYAFLDWFVPPDLALDPEAVQRVRIFVTSHLLGAVSGIIMLAYLLGIHSEYSTGELVVGSLFFAFILNPIILKLSRAYLFVSMLAILEFVNLVFYTTYHIGGGWSFALYWALPLPLIAGFWIGRRMATFTLLIVAFGIYEFYLMETSGHAFPEPLSSLDGMTMNMLGLLTAMVFVTVVGKSYEAFYTRSQKALKHEILLHEQSRIELHDAKERVEVTLASIGDGVITVDGSGRIEFMNSIAAELTGWSLPDAVGLPIGDVFHVIDEDTREQVISSDIHASMVSGRVSDGGPQLVLISSHNREVPIDHSIGPVRDKQGKIVGAVYVFHDVTEARQISEQLSYQASHDSLTGLVNRHEFLRRTQRIFDSHRAVGGDHAICYLDLVNFKYVNDTSGHVAGDQLLTQIGMLLKESVRKRDTLARTGGDEFAILLEHCPVDRALQLAEEVLDVISSFKFSWGDQTFSVGVSIGVVPFSEHFHSHTALLDAADAACYQAKDKGDGGVHLYVPEAGDVVLSAGGSRWAELLNQALNGDGFQLYVQSISALASPDLPGEQYEVLLRMDDQNGEEVPASVFLPVAERYNMMPRIDQWVVSKALHWFDDYPDVIESLRYLHINLASASICSEEFLQHVHTVLDSVAIPASKVCFEITELAAINNLPNLMGFVSQLKRRGCRFALDDFSSGLPSLAFLKSLAVNSLKIDGQYVRDVVVNKVDYAMVKAVVEVGHSMNLEIIAKSVESGAVLAKLREAGVDFVQGYSVARPVPIASILQAHTKSASRSA